MDKRTKAVLLYTEGIRTASEAARIYGVCERSLRRWVKRYRRHGLEGLRPGKTGPKKARHGITRYLERRIIHLKQKHPHWGARRIKHQFNLPVH